MTYKSGRHFLQIPGPTNVPDRILRAMDRMVVDNTSATTIRPMRPAQPTSPIFIVPIPLSVRWSSG